MKSVFKLTAIAALAVLASPGASAKTSCEEVMAKIEAKIQAKGVTFCVIGRKEVKRYAALGVDLSEIEGLQVLVGSDGAVVTAYRNRDLHAIRATSRRTRRRHQNH